MSNPYEISSKSISSIQQFPPLHCPRTPETSTVQRVLTWFPTEGDRRNRDWSATMLPLKTGPEDLATMTAHYLTVVPGLQWSWPLRVLLWNAYLHDGSSDPQYFWCIWGLSPPSSTESGWPVMSAGSWTQNCCLFSLWGQAAFLYTFKTLFSPNCRAVYQPSMGVIIIVTHYY